MLNPRNQYPKEGMRLLDDQMLALHGLGVKEFSYRTYFPHAEIPLKTKCL